MGQAQFFNKSAEDFSPRAIPRGEEICRARTASGLSDIAYGYGGNPVVCWSTDRRRDDVGTNMATTYGYYSTGESGGPATAPKSVTLTDGGSTVVRQTYTYDATTRRLETVASAGSTDTYGYLPNTDMVASLTSSNNITTSYQYEPDTGRLQSISWYCGTTTVYSIAYEYNANDQRTSATETRLLENGQLQIRTYRFEYDAQDHLTVFEVKDVNGAVIADRSFTYSYDSLGNRTNIGFSVNALNQYTLIPGVEDALTYDGRGNTTYDGTRVMTYDAQDRLRSVVKGSIKEEYDYDYTGRRTVKRTYDAAGENWTLRETRTFAYAGGKLIAEFVTDATHTTPTLARAYTWGLGLVGGLLRVTDYLAPGGAQTYKPFFNGNGDVMGLTDSTGAVVARYEYDPYGKELSATGPAAGACPFRSATMYCDDATGIYYVQMRYYSPDLQRWLTRDPIEENGGANLYEYCGSDPVNKFDPTGLFGWSTILDAVESVSSYSAQRRMLDGQYWVTSQLANCAESKGWNTSANVLRFGNGMNRSARGIYDSLDTNPALKLRQVIGLCQDVSATAEQIGWVDAGVVCGANNVPVLNWVVKGSEMYEGRNVHGVNFGMPLGPEDYGNHTASMLTEAGTLAYGIKGSMNARAALARSGGMRTTPPPLPFRGNTSPPPLPPADLPTLARESPLPSPQNPAMNARLAIPGDADFIGPIQRSWSLAPEGMGAHIVERVNVRGRPALAALDQAGTPRFYPNGSPQNAGAAHVRIHQATRDAGIGLREGANAGLSDAVLLERYRRAYSDPRRAGIRGDLRTPDGGTVITRNVTPIEAYQALMRWFAGL